MDTIDSTHAPVGAESENSSDKAYEVTRRRFLAFVGGAAVLTATPAGQAAAALFHEYAEDGLPLKGVTPLRLPHPLPIYAERDSFLVTGLNGAGKKMAADAAAQLDAYEVVDDVVVSPEYERYMIVAWGDRVFPNPSDYVGFNHDYTGFVPVGAGKNAGLLWINHEYVSFPFSTQSPQLPENYAGQRESFTEAVGFPLPQTVNRELMGEFLYNTGGTVVYIRRGGDGRFAVVPRLPFNRRVHGLSGLGINAGRSDKYASVTSWGRMEHQKGDDKYLIGTGPAARDVFAGVNADGLGIRVIGTSFNCSGGTTPWGTILSSEENFQAKTKKPKGRNRAFVGVQEQVMPNGSQTGYIPHSTGEHFGLIGEKYGWMVEIPVKDSNARALKHTALGRFRHENIALRVVPGEKLVAYMGDDRRGGHTYKFVSNGTVKAIDDPGNSDLLADGILSVARYEPGDVKKRAAKGKGRWIPLTPSTRTDPLTLQILASVEVGIRGKAQRDGHIFLPQRSGIGGATKDGGKLKITLKDDAAKMEGYRGKTLGDFYASQGAILCDCYLASNLAGGTPGARPEDIEVHPDTGEVFIAYTDGEPGGDGYPDSRVFTVTKYTEGDNDTQPFGGIYKMIDETPADAAGAFSWDTFVHGGEVGARDGAGFSSADNMVFDRDRTLWTVTDMSTSRHNGFKTGIKPGMRGVDHKSTTKADELVGVFGNNWLFAIPTKGADAGKVIPVAYGPVRCEMTGPTFVGDTLIIAVQHPGEGVPIGDGSMLEREIELLSMDGGKLFKQNRKVPLGSNWPSNVEGNPNGAPKSATIAIAPKKS